LPQIGLVNSWADQSGGVAFAGPYDEYPIFNASDLNGKPTITLSSLVGNNRSFELLNAGAVMGATGTTAFVVNYVDPAVFSVDGEGGDVNGALLGNFGSASDGSHWPYGLANSVYDAFATAFRKDDLGLPTGINDWNIYGVSSQTDDYQIHCNGTLFYSDTDNSYSNSTGGDNGLYIGLQNNAGSNQIFKGKVAEIVIYNRVLTTPERQQVEEYLRAKYALY
jgi:hypothetical protein